MRSSPVQTTPPPIVRRPGRVFGSFLAAASAAVGANASSLSLGSAGAPSVGIATMAGSSKEEFPLRGRSGDGGLSAGAVAGIVIAMSLLLVLVCLVLLYCRSVKRRQQEECKEAVPPSALSGR